MTCGEAMHVPLYAFMHSSSAGRRTGLDANVLAAYCKYAQEMEDLDASITSVYWVLFHKPTPDDEGGCRFDDLTWGKRAVDFDNITWEGAKKRAREEVVEYDENGPLERDNDTLHMLGAATAFNGMLRDSSDDDFEFDRSAVDLFTGDDE